MGDVLQMYPQQNVEKDFVAKCKKQLLGRTIKNIRFMTEEEREANGWSNRGIVIVLDDNHILYPMADDEGNNSGAMGTSYKNLQTIGRF